VPPILRRRGPAPDRLSDPLLGKITLTDSPPYPVEQGGTRKLWDEVLAAYQWWREHDEPRVADWLITVGPDGQRISLDRASGE
jgi:hypothetical protein